MIRAAPRDLEAIRLIAERRFVTRPQLEALLFADTPFTERSRQVVTWRVLGRLQRASYVGATPRQTGSFRGGSSLPAYFLTSVGLRLASTYYRDLPARRPARRAPFLLAHSVMATDVELAFRRTARGRSGHELELWECDWQIAMRLGERTVIPDVRIVYRLGAARLRAFIEIDLGTEGTRFFARKVDRYVQLYRGGAWTAFLPRWPAVLTVTPTDARATSLCEATTAALDRSSFASRGMVFKFCAIDALQGESGALAAHWRVASEKELLPLATPKQLAAADA